MPTTSLIELKIIVVASEISITRLSRKKVALGEVLLFRSVIMEGLEAEFRN